MVLISSGRKKQYYIFSINYSSWHHLKTRILTLEVVIKNQEKYYVLTTDELTCTLNGIVDLRQSFLTHFLSSTIYLTFKTCLEQLIDPRLKNLPQIGEVVTN